MLIKDLQERYNITRKPLYSRIKSLGIELDKDSNNKSFATEEQVERLDQLNDHLKSGGNLKNFVPVTDVEVNDTTHNTATQSTTQKSENQDSKAILDTTQPATQTTQLTPQELIRELTKEIAFRQLAKSIAHEQRSPLWDQEELEKASQNGWLLTTKQVKEIIGVKPVIKPGKTHYKRGIWKFIKAGKIGTQTAWQVIKSDLKD